MGAIVTAGAEHTIKQAKIDGARVTQAASNKRAGAESELARFSASLGNQRIMDAAGSNINNIGQNIGRTLDAATYGTLEERVSAAEELGAHAAMAGAAGVGGSSQETYESTLRLNEAMKEEQQQRQTNSETIDAGKAKGIALTDAVAGLDNNVYAANVDLRTYADDKKMSAFTAIAGTVATAAATYFGGPQAGQSVQDAMMADYKASNGDMAASTQYLTSAYKGAKSGIAAYRAGGAWGANIHI